MLRQWLGDAVPYRGAPPYPSRAAWQFEIRVLYLTNGGSYMGV